MALWNLPRKYIKTIKCIACKTSSLITFLLLFPHYMRNWIHILCVYHIKNYYCNYFCNNYFSYCNRKYLFVKLSQMKIYFNSPEHNVFTSQVLMKKIELVFWNNTYLKNVLNLCLHEKRNSVEIFIRLISNIANIDKDWMILESSFKT